MDNRPVGADAAPKPVPTWRGGVAGSISTGSSVLVAAGDGDREGCAARGSTRPAEDLPSVPCVAANAAAKLAFDSACLGEGGADGAAEPFPLAGDVGRDPTTEVF